VTDQAVLTEEFGRSRGRLRAIAYRMLGSAAEADDAVQETWLRAWRADTDAVRNMTAWLTTVTGRVCLDMLRSRQARREDPVDPDPELADASGGPEDEAIQEESIGLAMLVVLDRLSPAERVAFVLHDLFGVPFEEIAPIVDRSPVTAKKLASRARHRVRGGAARRPAADLARQREVVAAFLAASRSGDIGGLLTVLAPDVVRRADPATLPPASQAVLRGARAVAEETRGNAARARFAVPALVDGAIGVVVAPRGQLALVIKVGFDGDRITALDIISDPDRLREIDLAVPPRTH
jgi:RNA polymerase sigma-70 factor, ECF subfamily